MKLFISILLSLTILARIDGKTVKKRGLFIADDCLWCGSGNKAPNCDSLGEHAETDSCCREHDYCPYTFSILSRSYNGYTINSLRPLSHCDCDIMFDKCLLAKPYKKGSYYIWESYYEALSMQCFAYLPCSNDSTLHKNIWNKTEERRTGECYDGFRVTVFDSIHDYSEFMHKVPVRSQKELIRDALEQKVDTFMSDAKKNATCLWKFPDNHLKMVDSFKENFLQEEKVIETTTQNELTSSTTTDATNNQELPDDFVKIVDTYGFHFTDRILIILLGSGVIIPGVLYGFYLMFKKIQKTWNRYAIVKGDITDL